MRKGHGAIVERIKKTLYYGKNKGSKEVMECPSLPMTEVTVEMFERAFETVSKQTTTIPDDIETHGSTDSLNMRYAASVSSKACISPCCVVLALIYMERLKSKNPDYLKSVSSCDIFLVSMMIASKYLFDDGETEEVFNDEWAVSGSIDLKILNQLEIGFLTAIDWELHVYPEDFFAKLQKIETLVTLKEAKKRRYADLTYHEMVYLTESYSIDLLFELSQNFLKTIIITFITYSALLASICATSLIIGSIHSYYHRLHSPSVSNGPQSSVFSGQILMHPIMAQEQNKSQIELVIIDGDEVIVAQAEADTQVTEGILSKVNQIEEEFSNRRITNGIKEPDSSRNGTEVTSDEEYLLNLLLQMLSRIH